VTSARSREHFYDSIAERFEGLDHPADLRRRLRVVFDECLGPAGLHGKRTLDAGCGYGPFSAAAMVRGAAVLSVDIGPRLVARTMARAGSRGLVADACHLPVRGESFDVVISSEMLEHTRAPLHALGELARVLRPDGLLVLTTPNRAWQGVVRAASALRLRPFRGWENFVGWRDLERSCTTAGLDVVVHVGFHPWPFQLGLGGLAARIEKHFARGRAGRLMVNQALVARKRPAARLTRPGRPP
jgi:2-polyprenyl-6-hydroxyphenyl methylase/3-demethylubiquinone-9 3-methyltransferase